LTAAGGEVWAPPMPNLDLSLWRKQDETSQPVSGTFTA
jgi:hypothetical protein